MSYVIGGLGRTSGARRSGAARGARAARTVPVGGFLDTLLKPIMSTAQNVATTVGIPTDAEQMLARLVEDIEVRTAFTPPQYFKVSEMLAPGPASPTTKIVKPTIIMSGGSLGRKVIAPGGEAGADDWMGPAILASIAAVVGVYAMYELTFQLGKYRGRKSVAEKASTETTK